MTIESLTRFLGSRQTAEKFLPHLLESLPKYGIDTTPEIRHFMSQAAHESMAFTRLVENTNYTTPERLMKIFPKYFKKITDAQKYAGHPEAIANRVYANRMGNGNELSGDGYRYRGRGIFHLTGRDNYLIASKRIYGDDRLILHPELVAQPKDAVLTACWYWQHTGMGLLVNQENALRAITIRLNGGLNGLNDRAEWYEKAKNTL